VTPCFPKRRTQPTIGQQISAFTLGKNRIWIAYERVNKLYEKQIQDLQETQP
jgi:hypothetical protein